MINETQLNEHFQHISYEKKISRSVNELVSTDPNLVMKRWRDERDNLLWGIYGWKVYVIGAESWIGKTTFVNQVARNVARTWTRVVKYSLEDRMEDIGKEELYYEINRWRFPEERYDWVKFVNNEYWTIGSKYYDEWFDKRLQEAQDKLSKENIIELDKIKQINIEELVYLMSEECYKWTKLFVIDHLHYFEFDGKWDRLDLQIQNVMQQINELARKRNIAVILVAHYRNNTPEDKDPDPSWFKDWASIKQVANIIIQIVRDDNEWKSYFHLSKLRWPIKKTVLETTFNLSTFEYSFTKSQKQISKEQEFMKK